MDLDVYKFMHKVEQGAHLLRIHKNLTVESQSEAVRNRKCRNQQESRLGVRNKNTFTK